jgi:hypothetical protein
MPGSSASCPVNCTADTGRLLLTPVSSSSKPLRLTAAVPGCRELLLQATALLPCLLLARPKSVAAASGSCPANRLLPVKLSGKPPDLKYAPGPRAAGLDVGAPGAGREICLKNLRVQSKQ